MSNQSNTGIQFPNRIYQYNGSIDFGGKTQWYCVTVAAESPETATNYVVNVLGMEKLKNVVPEWIMGAGYPTIWSQDGKEPKSIQAKILSNVWSK